MFVPLCTCDCSGVNVTFVVTVWCVCWVFFARTWMDGADNYENVVKPALSGNMGFIQRLWLPSRFRGYGDDFSLFDFAYCPHPFLSLRHDHHCCGRIGYTKSLPSTAGTCHTPQKLQRSYKRRFFIRFPLLLHPQPHSIPTSY